MSGSRLGFLRRGLITATLSDFGTYPIVRDAFIIFSSGLPITGKSSLTSFVGIGSNTQVEDLEDVISAVNSVCSIGVNDLSRSVWLRGISAACSK